MVKLSNNKPNATNKSKKNKLEIFESDSDNSDEQSEELTYTNLKNKSKAPVKKANDKKSTIVKKKVSKSNNLNDSEELDESDELEDSDDLDSDDDSSDFCLRDKQKNKTKSSKNLPIKKTTSVKAKISKTNKQTKPKTKTVVKSTKLIKPAVKSSKSVKSTKSTKSTKSIKSAKSAKSRKAPVESDSEESTSENINCEDSSESSEELKSTNKQKTAVKNNKILEVKTSQTGPFKQAIERISNIISECSIVFIRPDDDIKKNEDDEYYEEMNGKPRNKSGKSKKKNPGGIRIVKLTEEKNILVKLSLDAVNFDIFNCYESKIIIGVDMNSFNTHLKSVNESEPITLYMNRDDKSVLYIRNIKDEENSSEETDISFNLIETDDEDLPIPKTEFQNIITMASEKFNKICKDLSNHSDFVDIKSLNNEISFTGQSEYGKIRKTYRDTSMQLKKSKITVLVQGIYELKNLLVFSKCNKLCDNIEIYLKDDFPLVLVISVSTLGKMYIFLTPKIKPNN